jgi:hypothetical protein
MKKNLSILHWKSFSMLLALFVWLSMAEVKAQDSFESVEKKEKTSTKKGDKKSKDKSSLDALEKSSKAKLLEKYHELFKTPIKKASPKQIAAKKQQFEKVLIEEGIEDPVRRAEIMEELEKGTLSERNSFSLDMKSGVSYNLKKLLRQKGVDFGTKADLPHMRREFEISKLKDPRTGKIPEGIREASLAYINSAKSGLTANSTSFGFRPNIGMAAGDQLDPWVKRGPYNVGGRTRALAFDTRNENILLAGGVAGGMWRSTDQGATWIRVTTNMQHPSVTDIEQDPINPDTWYYSTGERSGNSASGGGAFFQGNGIYKSTDNGLTWNVLSATQNPTPQSFDNHFDLIWELAINPVNSDIYAGTFNGVYRSQDGGATWAEILPGDFDTRSHIEVTSTGILYAAIGTTNAAAGEEGVWRSTTGDAGDWVDIRDASFPAAFGRTTLSIAPSNENIMYVVTQDGNILKYTYLSGDGTGTGGTWDNRSANTPAFGAPVGDFNSQGGYDLFIRVHPTNPDMVYVGGTNIYRSTDGFVTSGNTEWIAGYSPVNNISTYAGQHPDEHRLVFFNSDPNKAMSASDGGISITNDITASNTANEPVDWTFLNNGYYTTQPYALALGPQNQMMAGFQDNSTWFVNQNSATADWTDIFSGDGAYCQFNNDGTQRYVSSQGGRMFRVAFASADSDVPTNFTEVRPENGSQFITPFERDPVDDEIMYFAGGTGLWVTTNASTTGTGGWNRINTLGDITTIGVSTSPANVAYIGNGSGSVIRIDDATGAATATDISAGLATTGNISSIDVDPYDANHILVAISNYNIPSLFESTDGGATWTDVGGNLEENVDGSGVGPSVQWVEQLGFRDIYFVGTSTGVYSTKTLNGAATVWTNIPEIGNVPTPQIRIRNSNNGDDNIGLVAIATHGNGLYSGTFEITQPRVVIKDIIADVTVVQDSPDEVIDLSNAFESTASDAIILSVESNTNIGLVTATFTGSNLTLSFTPGSTGEATISINANDSDIGFATQSFKVTVLPPPVVISSFPYLEDFEDGAFGTGTLDGWETSDGDYAWLLNQGPTPTGNFNDVGPDADHTTGTATGFYVFTEASTPAADGDQADLLTPTLDLRALTAPRLEVWYHMFGNPMGEMEILALNVTTDIETSLWSISGQQHAATDDPYLSTGPLDLSGLGDDIRVIFRGTRENFSSDMAIDDMHVFEAPQNDLSVSNIIIDEFGGFSNTEAVTIEVANLGANDISGFDLVLELDGSVVATENYTGTITGGASADFTFATAIDLSVTTLTDFVLTAYPVYAEEDNAANDTFAITVTSQITVNSYPYNEGFESGSGSWGTADNGTVNSWEVGLPEGPDVVGASSSFSSWTTNKALDGNYEVDEQSWVYSPIFDFTNNNRPTLEFDLAYSLEQGFDGVALQVSTDLGQTWANLGAAGDAGNWFDGSIAGLFGGNALDFSGGNGDSWTGNSFSYKRASRAIDELGGESSVMFRFVLGSDFSVTQDGFSFDNIKVDEVGLDIEVVSIDMPTYGAYTANTPIVVTLRNLGKITTSNFDIAYVVDGGTPVSEMITAEIAFGETFQYTFTTQADLSVIGSHSVAALATLAGDFDNSNNLAVKNVATLALVNTFPYAESFEGTNGDWVGFTENPNELVSWERGIPDNTTIDVASDGAEAWVTNLSGNYAVNEQSYLLSPIFDFATLDPVFTADIFRDLESGFDGVSLQYSTDGGDSWINLGALGDLNGWFNQNVVAFGVNPLGFSGGNGDAWSATSAEYEGIGRFLPEFKGKQMIMRFALGSDVSFTQEGFALDNVGFVDRSSITSFASCDTIYADNDLGLATAALTIPAPPLNNADGSETIVNDFTGTDDASGTYPVGTTIVTWTLTVPDGFTDICEQVVVVKDAESPEITDCPSDILVIVETGIVDTVITFTAPTNATDNVGFTNVITQSDDQTLIAGNWLICPTGPNAYLRMFDLTNDYGITGDYLVTSVDFAIDEATSVSGSQGATVNLYAYNPNDAFDYPNFTLIASENFTVTDGDLFVQELPIEATIPAGMALVMEFTNPTGGDDADLIRLAGANAGTSTGDSYLFASNCGLTSPTRPEDIGFEDVSDLIFNVKTTYGIELLYTLESGERFPTGVTPQAYRIQDVAGNADTCKFTVTVLNDIEALGATNVTSSGFTANWTESSGAEAFLLEIATDELFTDIVVSTSVVDAESFAYYDRMPEGPKGFYYRVRVKSGVTLLPWTETIRVNLPAPSITALSASNITETSFTANWTAIAESADWIEFERSTTAFATSNISMLTGTTTNISEEVTGIGQIDYQYRVRTAWVFDGETTYSEYSSVISVAPKAKAPTNLTATSSLAGETPSVELDWKVNTTNTSSFQWVERATFVGSGDWRQILDPVSSMPVKLDVSQNSYTDTQVEQGEIYAYRVVSITPDLSDPTNSDKFLISYSNEVISGIVSSTTDELLESTTVVSPNPSTGLFRIEMNNSYTGMIEIQLYDVAGKLLLEEQLNKDGLNFGRTINLANKLSGMYMLRISSKDGAILRKLVKQD